MSFKLQAPYQPMGDQPEAIRQLLEGIRAGKRHQVLLGATGTGKTFTMANIINELQLPALVLAHNKTLAAQLYAEFKDFFPDNAVEYFVSYYDYYQPEAYVPRQDLYIEKEKNKCKIERLPGTTTQSVPQEVIVFLVSLVGTVSRGVCRVSIIAQGSYRRNAHSPVFESHYAGRT